MNDDERRPEAVREDVLLEVPLPHGGGPAGPPRLLANRPFLWLVLGDGFVHLGLWAFWLAADGEAAFRFDATPSQLGLLLSSYSLAFILCSPAFGLLADRWSPQRLILLAQMGTVGSIVVALSTDSLQWLYLALALSGGAIAAMRSSIGAMVPRLVPEDRLVQANGMLGVAWQVPLVVGPGLAGLLVRLWGPGAPYVAALVATGCALVCYAAVPDLRRERPEPEATGVSGLVAGFREGWRTPVLRWLFILVAAAWILLGVVITLEPLFVKEVLGRRQDTLGVLWAVGGVGTLVGSLFIARIRRGAGREQILVALGVGVGGVGYLVYVATSSLWVAVAGAVVLGFGFSLLTSPAQALIQRVAREPGRVTGVLGTLEEGAPLVASLALAALGGLVAVQPWLVASAVGVIVAGAAALRTRPRPLPEEV